MGKKKQKRILSWIKNPLFYIPLIGISVYLIFFRPHNNNIIRDKDGKIYCASTESQEERLRLICWKSDGILVEDAIGNRFVVDKEKIQCNDSIVLKAFNPGYEYYIKMESPETLFRNMTIEEVVGKTGDYVYANVEKGEYYFPQVVAVQGKVRHYGLTVFIGEDGKVAYVESGEHTSSNWFGALPFYSDIVSLNMLTATSEPILRKLPEEPKSKGIIGWILTAAWNLVKLFLFIFLYLLFFIIVFAIPLFVIFPILRLFSFNKSVPNWLIGLTVWTIGLVIVYVITIAQVEGTRQIWLITLPLSLIIGLLIIAYYHGAVENARCPECRNDNAIQRDRKPISIYTYIWEEDHAKTLGTRYVGKVKTKKIYHVELDCYTTETEITITEYLVTCHCKFCGYTYNFMTKETEKGEPVETDRWRDYRVKTKKIAPRPTYTGDNNTITDDSGTRYDRIGDCETGGNIVQYQGKQYRKR